MKRPSTRGMLSAAITWLVLCGLSLIMGLFFFNPFPNYQLAKSSVQTEGHVTTLEPTNHQIVHYSYSVGSQEYKGTGHAGDGNPSFENLRTGQTVKVFYDPTNPQSSSLGYSEAQLYGNLWGAVLTALIVPSIVVVGLYRMGYYR